VNRPRRIKLVERYLTKLDKGLLFGEARRWSRTAVVDPRQSHREYLDTIVHEALHILFPRFKERRIRKISRELSDFLWRARYRRVAL